MCFDPFVETSEAFSVSATGWIADHDRKNAVTRPEKFAGGMSPHGTIVQVHTGYFGFSMW